jgi:hypothetical protein
MARCPLSGLNYAQYVVTDDQITGLCRGAMARFAANSLSSTEFMSRQVRRKAADNSSTTGGD